MKITSAILCVLCASAFCLRAQNCYTNYNAFFIWGTNTPSGSRMTLYNGGQQVGFTVYPDTNIAFGINQMPNGAVPYIQGQAPDGSATHEMLFPTFDTNNFPLPAGITNSPPTPAAWGDPVPIGYTPNTN